MLQTRAQCYKLQTSKNEMRKLDNLPSSDYKRKNTMKKRDNLPNSDLLLLLIHDLLHTWSFTWFTWSMVIKEDHRSLLRAQCYKLVQIANIGNCGIVAKKRKNQLCWHCYSILFATRKRPPIGAGGQSYKLWVKLQNLLAIRCTGTKIAIFQWAVL
jgi:hypothetical protein